jgi:hypothetical protein
MNPSWPADLGFWSKNAGPWANSEPRVACARWDYVRVQADGGFEQLVTANEYAAGWLRLWSQHLVS